MPITPPSASSTGLSGGGCAPSCASRKSAQGGASVAPTINDGQMPSSRKPGCSRFTRPGYRRDSLDEETTDWRAVCEKTARTVRREGSAKADPYPYINYYGRFSRSALFSLADYVNQKLKSWIMRKYKRFRFHKTRASLFLRRLARDNKDLFVHWQAFGTTTFT